MIRSFRSKALKLYWSKRDATKIAPALVGRVQRVLMASHAAQAPEDMNLAGFDVHALRGRPKRYSVHVNGPWCVTFGWDGEDAASVDLENYR